MASREVMFIHGMYLNGLELAAVGRTVHLRGVLLQRSLLAVPQR